MQQCQAGIEGQGLPLCGHGHELQHPRHGPPHGRVLSGRGLGGGQQARQVRHQPPGSALAHPVQYIGGQLALALRAVSEQLKQLGQSLGVGAGVVGQPLSLAGRVFPQ